MADGSKVCRGCGAEATRVLGRRRDTGHWWCWRCEKVIQPIATSGASGAIVPAVPITAFHGLDAPGDSPPVAPTEGSDDAR